LGLFGPLPDFKALEKIPDSENRFWACIGDGILLVPTIERIEGSVKYGRLISNLVNAFDLSEDVRIEEHSGIDMIAMYSSFCLIYFA